MRCTLKAIASYQKCLDLSSGSRNAGQNKLLGLNYIIPGEDQVVSDAHANWGREFEEMFVPLAPIDLKNYDMNTNRILRVSLIDTYLLWSSKETWLPIRFLLVLSSVRISVFCALIITIQSTANLLFCMQVGYISPDLYTHSVSYFAEAPLACHNAARVHHIVYNCSPKVSRSKSQPMCQVS